MNSHLGQIRARLLASRIVRGSAVGFIGIGLYAVGQILSVPVLSKAFGIEGYGVWLLISAIPTYLALAELGFTQAAAGEMTMSWAADRRETTLRVLQSVSLLLLLICGAILVITAMAVLIALGLHSVFVASHWPVIALFAVWQVLNMLSGLPNGLLRATGHFVRATLIWDAVGFLEILTMLGVATWTRDLEMAALSLVTTRATSLVFQCWQVRRHRPEIWFGRQHASRAEMRRLFVPAAGMMTMPLATAISLQGTVIVIGSLLGPAVVATFTPMRTVGRLILQLLGAITGATVPELASARGRGDETRVRRLWRHYRLVAFAALTSAAIGVAVLGVPFVRLWTGGHIQPSYTLALVVGIDVLPFGWWYLTTMLLAGTNEHVSLVKWILAVVALGCGLSVITTTWLGLPGTVLALIAVDATLAIRAHLFANARMRP